MDIRHSFLVCFFCLLCVNTTGFSETLALSGSDPTHELRLDSAQEGEALPGIRETQAAPQEGPAQAKLQKYDNLDDLFTLYQPYLKNISAYQPMYFLLGLQPEKTKFQFSLKYAFFNPDGSLAQSHPWIKGIHFAYTQTSHWNLKSDSKAFEDTSYKPELFFLSSGIDLFSTNVNRLFIQTGYLHESNGRDGESSRATDHLYMKPIFILFNERSQLGLQVAPEIFYYISNENRDMPDYRGYFNLEMKCGQADGFVLESHWYWAREGASVQLDLTYPLNRLALENIDLYFHIQYTNRLAESLLYYKKRTNVLRVGFSLVR